MKPIRLLFKIFTVALAVAATLSALSGHLDPNSWWFISLSGLVFLPLAAINTLCLTIWLFADRKFAMIPAISLLIILYKSPLVIQIGGVNKPPDKNTGTEKTIKVVSFNARLFDLYNWSASEQTRQEIFQTIKAMDPDVVCFQEFFTSKPRGLDNVKDLHLLLGMPYHHAEYSITKFMSDHYGIATFSKYPIVEKEVVTNSRKSTNLTMYSDIRIGSDTIRVINCHLQSIRFNAADYEFIEDPTGTSQTKEQFGKAFNILKRMKKAYSYRSEQANKIAALVEESRHRILVCGDFNDTPLSFTYQTISEKLNDSFTQEGSGFGQTYAGPLPGLRIDYILFDDHFSLKYFKTHNDRKLSDHYALEAILELNQ